MSNASDFFSGGGGGIPVNGQLGISTNEKHYVAPDKTEWIRTGCVETSVGLYPEATIYYENMIPNMKSIGHITVGRDTDTTEIAVAASGEQVYVLDRVANAVSIFSKDGIFQSKVVLDESIIAFNILFKDNQVWILDKADVTLKEFRTDLSFTGREIDLTNGASGITDPVGVTWTGAHYYILCRATDKIARFDSLGSYSTITFDIDVSTQAADTSGLAYDSVSAKLYIISTSNVVYVYDTNNGYEGTNYDMSSVAVIKDLFATDGESDRMYLAAENGKVYFYETSSWSPDGFDSTSLAPAPRNIYYDQAETSFLFPGTISDSIIVYNGNPMTTSPSAQWSVFAQGEAPRSIIRRGNLYYVLITYIGAAGIGMGVYTYNLAGAYQNEYFLVENVSTQPRALADDGSHYWLLDWKGQIYQYDYEGAHTGVVLDISRLSVRCTDLMYDATTQNFWVATNEGLIHEVTSTGEATGNVVNPEIPNLAGITLAGSLFYALSGDGGVLGTYSRERGVGRPVATQTDSGLRNYIRIK